MTRKAACTQAEIRRALKAAREAGYQVAGFEITERGLQVIFGEPGKLKRASSLDRFLNEAPQSS